MESIIEEKRSLKNRLARFFHHLKFNVLPKTFLFLLHVSGFLPCSENEILNRIFIGANIFHYMTTIVLIVTVLWYFFQYQTKAIWFYTTVGTHISE